MASRGQEQLTKHFSLSAVMRDSDAWSPGLSPNGDDVLVSPYLLIPVYIYIYIHTYIWWIYIYNYIYNDNISNNNIKTKNNDNSNHTYIYMMNCWIGHDAFNPLGKRLNTHDFKCTTPNVWTTIIVPFHHT